MPPLTAISLFCEDIREEVGGTETIVGIMPDNVNVPSLPFSFPKLAIYTRINLTPDFDPGVIELLLRFPDGSELSFHKLDPALIKKARNDASATGNPIGSVISRIIAPSFPVKQSGRMRLVVRTPAADILSGTLNVNDPA